MLREGVTEETAVFRLSPQQEQLWRTAALGRLGRVRCVVDLPEFDPAAVLAALQRAAARHEILRTAFVRRPGMKLPGQAILDQLEPSLAVEADPDAVIAAQLTPDGQLTITVPAACADLRSLALLAAEVHAGLAGSPIDGDPLQYADYTEWRLETIAAGAQQSEPDDLPRSPSLPFVREHDVKTDGAPAQVTVELDAAAVAQGAEACDVAPAVFLEACWHATVARVSGDGVISIAHVFDGRTQQELENAIGPYSQALALMTAIDDTTSIAEIADRVRREQRRLEQQQDTADGEVLARTASTCRIGFSHVRYPDGAGIRALVGAPVPFLVNLCLFDDGEATRLELQVAPPLVESGTAGLLARTLSEVIAAAGADVTSTVAELTVLPADLPMAEQSAFAGADEPHTSATVTELFDAVVARAADVAAVVAQDGTLTYRELDERATRLASRLREQGVGPNTTVALCFERSAHSIVALLAVLKAGGAYLPLNFEHPVARLAHQLRVAQTKLLLTEARVVDCLPTLECAVLVVDVNEAGDTGDRSVPANSADDLVYVMYTSGSSGTPKGVGVTHGNLATYATSVLDRLELGDTTGVSFAAVSALSTDLGNTSIFAALLGGGTLHLVAPADALDGPRFAAYIAANPVDVLKITPSHLRALLDATESASVLPRQLLVLGGEALTWDFVDRVRGAGAPCRVVNHYGPTETTIGVCTFEPEAAAPQGSTVPIGRPLARSRIYVVDSALRLLPIGIPGELLIGGDQVARGYVGDAAQTAERFLPDPFAGDEARVYRTGDRVRALRDGTIEFLGRVDDQVKIHGYRVEPSEVQAVLATHPAVRQCAVVARADGDDHELVAYIVCLTPILAEDAKAFLRQSLPAHMIPARIVELEALPLTASGKIDRHALPDPETLEGDARDYVAPRTPLEEELARIWQELLGVERVGVHDDFFSLGGHSLLATQAVIRIRKTIGDVPLHSLLNAPTVSALAEAIVDAELEATAADDAV